MTPPKDEYTKEERMKESEMKFESINRRGWIVLDGQTDGCI